MVSLTNFQLVLRICILNAIIFIKKNIGKLVQDNFQQNFKDPEYHNFGYVDKIKYCFFSLSLIFFKVFS